MSKAKFNAKKYERPGLTEDEIEQICRLDKGIRLCQRIPFIEGFDFYA